MGLGAKPRKGLSLPAPNSEHTFQQLLQGPLQGRILSNLCGTLRGRAIAHHLDPRDNFQNHCYYPLLSISALHFQSHDLNDILCRDMTSKKKKEKIINPLLVSRKEKKDFSRTRRHLQDHSIYKKNQTFATSGFRFFFSLMRRNFKDLSIFFSPNSFSLSYLYLYREKRGDKIKEKKKKKKNECTRATGNAGAGDESSALPRRMPSAGSWNATRRPDPLTAGQKLLLPLALPLGPSLPPSPLPLFLTASCIQLWLNFGREYSESMPLCVYVYYSRIPLLESIALEIVSRWYRIDTSGAVEREGGKVLDGCGFRCYHWIWNRERRARIRGRKLIFEYLEIDFDIYRREFWIIVIAWYR